jgi:hypothetical protein
MQTAPTAPAPAPSPSVTTSEREFFLSWGYNGDNYSNSDLHISQPSLGNDFTYFDVSARDSKAWTDLFNHSLTVPQYNVRFGMFLNEKWGVEVALDHIKWIVRQDQEVRAAGMLNGSPVDTRVALTEDVLKYQLNNGANPVFINLIRRYRLTGGPRRTGSIAILLKAGGGFAVPHTENTVFGELNEPGFQFFIGWTADVAAAVRAHLWRGLYFEFEDKLLYARYSGVHVDQGEARHSVKANEFNWNFGWAF